MSEKVGQKLKCDRCGKEVFLERIDTKEFDGGFGRKDVYQNPPAGWIYKNGVGDLCPECGQMFNTMLNEFLHPKE